jgi:predicted nucleic acid-binding protein
VQIVPDSDIFISALVYGGKPLQLLEMGLEREVRLLTSPAILDERSAYSGTSSGIPPSNSTRLVVASRVRATAVSDRA